jgi:hypothetical protein
MIEVFPNGTRLGSSAVSRITDAVWHELAKGLHIKRSRPKTLDALRAATVRICISRMQAILSTSLTAVNKQAIPFTHFPMTP